MELLEALKANTDVSIYVCQEKIPDSAEIPQATRNKKFSTHSDLIEITDRRATLCKYVKFAQRTFEGDPARDTVVPIKTSSKELPQQIKTGTEQTQKNHRQALRGTRKRRGIICTSLSGVSYA